MARTNRYRSHIRLRSGVAALALVMGSTFPVWAQVAAAQSAPDSGTNPIAPPPAADAAPRKAPGLEEIVVTARRVQENLQRVPISVGVLNSSAIESRQIASLNDLKGAVAGLTTSRTATPGTGYITIRGVTASSQPSPAIDSGIGFYIDGVYIARQQGSGVDIADLAEVEVLRGPQGTLFGRNSTAGAISFNTNAPTQKFEAKLNALYGNYDNLRLSGIVNVPITSTLAVRVTYQHIEEDGDVKNTTKSPGYIYAGLGTEKPAATLGADNSDSLSARVRFTGIQGLTVDYKYDREKYIETSGASQLLGFLPTPLTLGGLVSLYPIQAPGAVTQSLTRLGSIAEDFQSKVPITNSGHLLTLEYKLSDDFTVKSISAWRSTRDNAFSDLDGGDWRVPLPPTYTSSVPFCVVCSYTAQRQHQFSEEGQIIGDLQDLKFIIGGYYFLEHASFVSLFSAGNAIPEAPAVYTPPTDAFVEVAPGVFAPGPYAIGADGRFVNRSLAAYAHADYAFTDQLKLALGARYTSDKRLTDDLRTFATVPVSRVHFGRFTYDAALNYQITPANLVYAKYATGYVSGGVINGLPFKPEGQRQAEIGMKSEFLERRLRVNAAAYYTWIKDRQDAVTSLDPTFNPTLAGVGFMPPYPLGPVLYNQPGTATVKGFEIETTYSPVDGLTLSANYARNWPKFTDGTRSKAPKETFSFYGQYDFPHFGNDSYVTVRLDGDYRSKYYGSGLDVAGTFSGTVPAALRPGYATSDAYLSALEKASLAGGYWMVNGRVSLADVPISGGAKAKISGFVRNIFNDTSLLYVVNYGIGVNGTFERPRTYGVEVNLEF